MTTSQKGNGRRADLTTEVGQQCCEYQEQDMCFCCSPNPSLSSNYAAVTPEHMEAECSLAGISSYDRRL